MCNLFYIYIVHQPRRYGLGARKTLPSNPPRDYINIVNICTCAILLYIIPTYLLPPTYCYIKANIVFIIELYLKFSFLYLIRQNYSSSINFAAGFVSLGGTNNVCVDSVYYLHTLLL